jgi:hypothetical protein
MLRLLVKAAHRVTTGHAAVSSTPLSGNAAIFADLAEQILHLFEQSR